MGSYQKKKKKKKNPREREYSPSYTRETPQYKMVSETHFLDRTPSNRGWYGLPVGISYPIEYSALYGVKLPFSYFLR